MATILGLRDSSHFPADERPKNWREAILRYYPRSEQKAPLNALIAGMKHDPTDDAEFSWFDKGSPVRYTGVNYSTGYNTTATTLVVDSSSAFRADDLIRNETTGEVMRVTADPASSTEVVVSRGWGSTAAAIADNQTLFVIGPAIMEGQRASSGLYNDPNKRYNLTQIFRYPLKLTNTAKATKLRTGNAWKEMKREALDMHTIDMERGMIWGVRNEDLTGTEPRRSTGGILSFITTNISTVSGGNLTQAAWLAFIKQLFQYGAGEKLCLCGNQFLMVINQMAEYYGNVQLTPNADIYGIAVIRYVTAFGTVYLKNHPLFNEITEHSKMGLFIEPKHIIYRPLVGNGVNRDTQYLKNREDNDEDCTKDEFLTECGLEVQLEKVHGVMHNVNALSTS